MSIKSAGEVIKEARKRAKLSQEALSDGICSYVTLCNIEKGTYGVSPLTFELLMERAGVYNQIYPIFENLNDYLCFWHLIHARFYISRWKYTNAQVELNGLQEKNFNNNKYYYQEWCLLSAWLEVKTGNSNHLELCNFLFESLHISKPNINLFDLRKTNLSTTEIKIILLYIAEYLVLGKTEDSLLIYNQIISYIENSKLSEKEKNEIDTKLLLIHALFYVFDDNFEDAMELVNSNIANFQKSADGDSLFFSNYIKSVCLYKLNQVNEFNKTLSLLSNCEKAMDTSFHNFADSYFKKLGINEFSKSNIRQASLSFVPMPDLGEGSFDIYGKDVMTIGSIIKFHREQQKIPSKILCEGLCGTALLSKIENNTINPDIILACTILNRLGISDEIFTFFGNKEESLYYDLKTKLLYGKTFDIETFNTSLQKLNELATTTKKVVIKQSALYFSARQIKDPTKKLEILSNAIKLTLKDFDIQNLTNYKLSRQEYNIIILMMNILSDNKNPLEAQIFYQQMSNYLKNAKYDITQEVQILPSATIVYYDFLYSYELYSNIVFDMNISEHSYLSYTVKGKAFTYYIYALALYKLKDFGKAIPVANVAVNLLSFLGFERDLLNLQNTINEHSHLTK